MQQQDINDNTILSKAQEEEMNSALIAKLLAQDAMDDGGSYYYAEYNNHARQYDPYKGNNGVLDDSYEEESDDYAPKNYGKPKKMKAKKRGPERRGRKRKNAPMDVNVTNADTTVEPIEAAISLLEPRGGDKIIKTIKPDKPKKVKKPLPPGFKTGVYTDEEEVLFLEGLNLHGRNWNDLSCHMGTRDTHSIRSHAQKHFIKLYRDNLPLPDKVKESGEGYTLSGKPLDPDSAAARPYLNRSAMGTKNSNVTSTTTSMSAATTGAHKEPASTTSDTEPLPGGTFNGDPMQIDPLTICDANSEAITVMEAATAGLNIGNTILQPTNQKSSPPTATKLELTSPSSKIMEKQTSRDSSMTTTYKENERTDYATSRLRRPEIRNTVVQKCSTNDGDRLTMVKCEPFNGKPGSDTLGAQPFDMTVHSNVLLTMDFHAHLVSSEIIGFLAGEWNRTSKRLTVKEAFPCRSLNTGQNEVNVEMDPTSALEIRQLIEEKDMTVVGWYHSHPRFVPDPSLVDIENQLNYQNLCRDKCDNTTTTTKTTNDTTSASYISVNIVQDSAAAPSSLASLQGDNNDDSPKSQVPELSDSKGSSAPSPSTSVVMEPFVGAIVGPYDPKLPASASVFNWFHVTNTKNEQQIPKQLSYDLEEDTALSTEEEERLFQLPIVYQTSPEKINFNDRWRPGSQETKLEKLIKSLGVRMPWIQRKILKLQQEQGTSRYQPDTVDVMSSAVNEINVDELKNTDGTDATEHQTSAIDDNELSDTFLEKVQTVLKNW